LEKYFLLGIIIFGKEFAGRMVVGERGTPGLVYCTTREGDVELNFAGNVGCGTNENTNNLV
jgi:hypothetical protein